MIGRHLGTVFLQPPSKYSHTFNNTTKRTGLNRLLDRQLDPFDFSNRAGRALKLRGSMILGSNGRLRKRGLRNIFLET